jgi:hypothetical protein
MGEEINEWPIAIPKDLVLSDEDLKQMVKETLLQIEKDMAMQGLQLRLNTNETAYPKILTEVSEAFEELRLIEDPRLIGFLYQVDLNQAKISARLTQAAPNKIYAELADAIIKKCFEKVCWRFRLKP